MKIRQVVQTGLVLAASLMAKAQTLPTNQIYSYMVPGGGYAPNNNLVNYSDQITGSWNMQYDNLNRLQSATALSGYYNGLTLQWQYDSFGNRLSQAPLGTSTVLVPGAISATYDQNNRILTSSVPGMGPSSYDAAGNVIFDGNNHIAYDAENRVCAVLNLNGTLTQYFYNAEGQRIAKGHSASGSALACPAYGDFVPDEKYILGQNGEQVTQFNTVNGADQWDHSNVWAGGQLLATYNNHPAMVNGQSVAQPLHFNITDALGSKRVQTSATGVPELTFASLPYGDGLTTVTGSGVDATQHHFTGKERDPESGLDYFGARYYSSNMGRFMSPDWAAKAQPVPYAKLENPQTLNLYAYVGNNPLSRTDPTGHYVCSGSKEQCAQIQDGLNLAKAAQAKLGADSKEGKAIGAVLKFYGAAGEKNGVGVSFGNLAKGTLGEASAGANGSVSIKFDLKQINSFTQGSMPGTSLTERAGTEVHEGRHGVDFRADGHGPENRHEEMQTERNAYRTQSYFYEGLGVETPTGLWSPSWSPANAEQNRNAAVQAGAERSTNAACAQGCQP